VPAVSKNGSGSPAAAPVTSPRLICVQSSSLVSFRLRRFIARTGHEVVMLVDKASGPAFYPTVFMTSQYDKTGRSPNTRESVLRAIGMARAWADSRGRDLDYDLRWGQFLNLDDIEALADHLTLSAGAQAAANTVASTIWQSKRKAAKLEHFRPNPTTLAKVAAGIKPDSAFSRIKWVAMYVEWHLQQRTGSAERSRDEREEMRTLGPQVLARLRQRGRGSGRRSMDDEALAGVSQEVIDLVSAALRPGDLRNPFTPGFVQERNHLLWHFFISTGGRREEVKAALVKDVHFATRRFYISRSKTRTRTVPISRAAADSFDQFIEDRWSRLPLSARKRGFLFTGQTGEALSLRSINRIFVRIRTRVPGCPDFLTPHTTRRTFNDRVSEHFDNSPPDKRISHEHEMRARNAHQGWSPNSPMGAVYGNRHIRRKADELGEELANEISRDESEDDNT
jgi:integrase